MSDLSSIRGMNPDLLKKVQQLGIREGDQLLRLAKDFTERQWLAYKLELKEDELVALLRWVELSRISGVHGVFAELLSVNGIASVGDLARAESWELYAGIQHSLAEKKEPPSRVIPEMVNDWIEQAQGLVTADLKRRAVNN